ncbi:MAG: HU family DNA-binding protein [Gammaproteobacteria bacterium]|nr:HU family DNA-binding protein [Gammaproteobacteria bacterium]MDH5731845.1 HU family DNA-binding protein [Gammaproteobacteria bacterium]
MAVKKKAKKAASKKKVVATKKTAAKKPAAKKMVTTAVREPMTKSQIFTTIAEETELSKKDVAAVFDSLSNLISRHVKKGGLGEFKVPGLMKIKVVKKPARKARKGVNPFTGEEMMFKAKPATNVVKVLALKALKDMA